MPHTNIEERKTYARAYYAKDNSAFLARNRKAQELKREYVRQAKNVPCMDCGQQFPYYVMDFDHRDSKTKIANVNAMMHYGWARIKAEIAKCDVVCANCHRIRTQKRLMAECPSG